MEAQKRDGHSEAQDPSASGKQRHVHVIQDEDLVAKNREPIEILRTLVVGDRGNRGLEPGHVRFERDRDFVATAALHAG